MKIAGVPIGSYTVIIPSDADKSTVTAKDELTEYIKKACGCTLPFRTDGEVCGYEILLDKCKRDSTAYALCKELKRNDSYVIRTEQNRLIICGKESEGTLYGVYGFIEKYLGAEWFTPQVETVSPQTENIEADEAYDFSCAIRICHGYNMFADEKFRARRRLHFTVGETNGKIAYGGLRGIEFAFSWGLFGHTFEVLVPYKKYFSAHPEWFSFAEGHYGEEGRHQICLTNPDVYEIALKNVLDYLDTNPNCKIVSVSQNDSYSFFENNYCKCPSCAAITEREGSYAGVNLQFVNKIAAEVEKTHPDVLVHTFCYKFTRTPPKTVRPRDNVLVQLCLNTNFGAALTDGEAKEEKEYFDKWRDISKNVYIWTYPCRHDAYSAPIGNFRAMYYTTRYLLKRGVTGIFQQENADYFPGNFSDLRFYLLSQLFINADITYEEYLAKMRKFLRAAYGESGKYIFEYIELLDGLFEGRTDCDDNIYCNKEFIQKGSLLWQKALSAESGEKAERVKKLSLQFAFAKLVYLYGLKEKGDYPSAAYEKEQEEYWINLKNSGAKRYKENSDLPNLRLTGFTNSPYRLGPKRKEIRLFEGERSGTYAAGANTNEKITDFNFGFTLKKEKDILHVDVGVTDGDHSTVNNQNMFDWMQDSVEIFVSETCSEDNFLSAGDYKIRVNAAGRYTAFGDEKKIAYCNVRETTSGYRAEIGIYLPDGCGKIGFEIMAHNMQNGKYVNTRYWNAYAGLLVPSDPSVYGKIVFEENAAR